MKTLFVLLLGCGLVSCGGPLAGSAGAAGADAFVASVGAQEFAPSLNPTPMPTLDYLLTLGPYGALVWGAWLLGKGITVTVRVELSDDDREVLEKAVTTFEKAALTFEKATGVAWNALKSRENTR
jgi:hypothetical protein